MLATCTNAASSSAPIASEAVRAVSSERWPYVSTVMPIEECRSIFDTIAMGTPAASINGASP